MAEDLELLRIANTLREYHHRALWEEEKHFTWLLSVLFTANTLVATSDKVGPALRLPLAIGLSALGVVFSLLALRVVHLESHGFQRELDNYRTYYDRVFQPLKQPQDKGHVAWWRKLGPVTRRLITGVSIRSHFQFVFVLFAVAFALFGLALALIR